jgi:DNA-binding winged helix-turn-helix (wHTH) protein
MEVLAQVRWRFANAEYNEHNHELLIDNVPVALEPKPLEVLFCLLRAEGEWVLHRHHGQFGKG